MRRRLTTLVNSRASRKTCEDAEDDSRYYDFDKAAVSSRPRSPFIDRQRLSPPLERQLQHACLVLYQKIQFPERWEDFSKCTNPTNDSRSCCKISSFTVPDHIAADVDVVPACDQDRLLNENAKTVSNMKNRHRIGKNVDSEWKRDSTHGQAMRALEQSFAPRPVCGNGASATFQNQFGGRATCANDAVTGSPELRSSVSPQSQMRNHNDFSFVRGISINAPTIAERAPDEAGQHRDIGELTGMLTKSTNQEFQSPVSATLLRNISHSWQQISQKFQLERYDTISVFKLEKSLLQDDLKARSADLANQKYNSGLIQTPILLDECETDSSINTLTDTESCSSQSSSGMVIIDENGLEKVMTLAEEKQRRLALERAVMAKMSGGGLLAPIPNRDKAVAPPLESAKSTNLTSFV
ncbi:hypothetical protein PABG_00256 [Paracoccidioides brasiliensis Pb03]|nr:hypothetical protein PABG_00256 [Paracoccidioides brasiliensis Pb03]